MRSRGPASFNHSSIYALTGQWSVNEIHRSGGQVSQLTHLQPSIGPGRVPRLSTSLEPTPGMLLRREACLAKGALNPLPGRAGSTP